LKAGSADRVFLFYEKFITQSKYPEHSLSLRDECFPVEFRPFLILDWGYARVLFVILTYARKGIPFCASQTQVTLPSGRGGQTLVG